jgi:hypothetical protein
MTQTGGTVVKTRQFSCATKSPRRSARPIVGGLLVLALVGALAFAARPEPSSAAAASGGRLDHIFVIVEENHGFSDVIGNRAAPNLNYLAEHFGLATDYYGVSHPSEPNYVALLGGSTFGINSDNAYWTDLQKQPGLISQLDRAGISWKAYLQGLPHPDYQGICYPARCNGAPDSDPLYASKHDGIQNFTTSLNPYDWSRQVPVGQLAADLQSGNVPRFDYIIPDECHDMHGDPPYCLDSGNLGDPQDQHLVAVGDSYLGQLVSEITRAPFWAEGNNAIVVTYDEGDNNTGCCDAMPGGGQVATVVVTSHGPRGVIDATPYNHYSLLSTIQHAYGLGCLQNTCDTANVQTMSPLFFAVHRSRALATPILMPPNFATPTPTPVEPTSFTSRTPRSGGWTVARAGTYGTSDNSLGAIAGSSPTDIWAVGDFLPDKTASNQDATLSFAEHFDGTTWSVVPTPNTGSNFNSFYGLAASGGQAWAVGEDLDARYQDRALIKWWNDGRWRTVDNPQPGSVRDLLFGASARSPSDVWVVGDQEGRNGKFETLAEHWNGSRWAVVPTPDAGTSGNHLYAVDAVAANDVWAVGQQLGPQAPDQGLVEHWNGSSWSVIAAPASRAASVMLDGVAVAGDQVWAVGESDSQRGAFPLVEHYQNGDWTVAALPSIPRSNWTDLWGVTVQGDAVWAVGTYLDSATNNNNALVLRGIANKWTIDRAPDPGSGSNILGGVTTVGTQAWAAGIYDNGGSELPFVERH